MMADVLDAENLLNAWQQLDGSSRLPDDARVQSALASADLTLSRYLGNRTIAEEVLRGVRLDLALFDLCGQAFTPEHPVYARWKAAIDWCTGIAKGTLEAPTDPAEGADTVDPDELRMIAL